MGFAIPVLMRAPFLFVLILCFFAGLAQAQVRCEQVFAAALSGAEGSLRLADELAQFQIEIEAMAKDTDRTWALDEFREKFRSLSEVMGPDFKEIYLDRLELARAGAVKDQAEKEQLADQVQQNRLAAVEWTRLDSMGLKDHGVFVGNDQYLAMTGNEYRLFDRNSKQALPWPAAVGSIAAHSKLARIAVTPDGRYLIVAELMGFIRRVDLQTGEEIKTQGTHDNPNRLEISSDGSVVAVTDIAGDGAILHVSSMKRVFERSLGKNTGWRDGIVISPDSHYVFFRRSGSEPTLVDTQTGREISIFKKMRAPSLRDAYFSADSKTLTAIGANKGGVYDYELATGHLKPAAFTFGAVTADHVHVSPDRSKVLMVNFADGNSPAFKLVETATGHDITPSEFKGIRLLESRSSVQQGSRVYMTIKKEKAGAEMFFMIYDFSDGSLRTFDHTSMGGYLRPQAAPDGRAVYVLKGTELYEIH